MNVTLLEVLAAAQARRSSLVGETIGYLVLAVADQVVDAPRRVAADAVLVKEDGAVCVQSSRACSSTEAEADLRSLLGELLAASRTSAGPLGRLAMREHPAGVRGLVSALEAALVPINRAAGRRALGRLHRETERAIGQGQIDVASFESAASPESEPPGRSEASDAPARLAPSVEPEASPDPVLEVGWTELDDDLDEAPYTEPPTARLSRSTAPLPLVAMPEHIADDAPGDHTQPLPPARPIPMGDAEEPHTAPLVSAAPVHDPSGPGPEALAEADSCPSQPLEAVTLEDTESEPLEPPEQAVGEDAESSVELGDYVAAAAGSQAPRPDFQPVPVTRRTFPCSGAQVDIAEASEVGERVEWVELEELEKSAPPPLVWFDGRHDQAGPRPTAIVEALLANFDGDQERLQLALELLGRMASEDRSPESPPAEGSEWELDLGLGAELGVSGRAPGPLAPPPDPAALWRAPRVFDPVQSDVDDLVGRFSVSAARSHPDLCRYLTEIAGLDPTPPPPPLVGHPIVPVGALARAR
jgi:hypothetical protein